MYMEKVEGRKAVEETYIPVERNKKMSVRRPVLDPNDLFTPR